MLAKPAMPDGSLLVLVKGAGVVPNLPVRQFTEMAALVAWQPEFAVAEVQLFCSEVPPNPAAAYESFDEGVHSYSMDGTLVLSGRVRIVTLLRAFDWAYGTKHAEGYRFG